MTDLQKITAYEFEGKLYRPDEIKGMTFSEESKPVALVPLVSTEPDGYAYRLKILAPEFYEGMIQNHPTYGSDYQPVWFSPQKPDDELYEAAKAVYEFAKAKRLEWYFDDSLFTLGEALENHKNKK